MGGLAMAPSFAGDLGNTGVAHTSEGADGRESKGWGEGRHAMCARGGGVCMQGMRVGGARCGPPPPYSLRGCSWVLVLGTERQAKHNTALHCCRYTVRECWGRNTRDATRGCG